MLAHAVCPITAPSSSRTRCWAWSARSAAPDRRPSRRVAARARSDAARAAGGPCAARRRRLRVAPAQPGDAGDERGGGGVVLGERRERVVEMSGEMCARAAHGVRRELLLGRAHQESAAQLAAREAADQELALRPERDFARGADCGRSRAGRQACRGRLGDPVDGHVETVRDFADHCFTGGGAFRYGSDQLPRLLEGLVPACGRVHVCIGKYSADLKLDHSNGAGHSLLEGARAGRAHQLGGIGSSRHLDHLQLESSLLRYSRCAQHRLLAGAIGVQREERRAVGLAVLAGSALITCES